MQPFLEPLELLDIVDEQGVPTGETVTRARAHEEGIRHRTSHVWLVRVKDGAMQVLLQKRSDDKDSFPGCYDISSAGHIPAGNGFEESAVRELREELGVEADIKELVLCGRREFAFERNFRGKPFRDRQVSNIYVLFYDADEPSRSMAGRAVWLHDYLRDALSGELHGPDGERLVCEKLGMTVASYEFVSGMAASVYSDDTFE